MPLKGGFLEREGEKEGRVADGALRSRPYHAEGKGEKKRKDMEPGGKGGSTIFAILTVTFDSSLLQKKKGEEKRKEWRGSAGG